MPIPGLPTAPTTLIDTNVMLGTWPFRRVPGDSPAELLARLRGQQVEQAWVGSFDGLFHRDLAAVNARLADECRHLADHAAGIGQRIAFEPEPGMLVDTMDRYAHLAKRVDHPAFGLTLDVGHLHCLGEVPTAPHAARWKERLWNIHIEDMRPGVHDHLPFGEGTMDFAEVFVDETFEFEERECSVEVLS